MVGPGGGGGMRVTKTCVLFLQCKRRGLNKIIISLYSAMKGCKKMKEHPLEFVVVQYLDYFWPTNGYCI